MKNSKGQYSKKHTWFNSYNSVLEPGLFDVSLNYFSTVTFPVCLQSIFKLLSSKRAWFYYTQKTTNTKYTPLASD